MAFDWFWWWWRLCWFCSLNSNELLLYRLPGVVVCYLLMSRAPDGALHLWEKQDGGGRRMGRAFFRPWLTVIDFLLSENGKRSSCFFFAAETLNVRSVGTCEFCFLKKNFRVKFIFFLKKKANGTVLRCPADLRRFHFHERNATVVLGAVLLC